MKLHQPYSSISSLISSFIFSANFISNFVSKVVGIFFLGSCRVGFIFCVILTAGCVTKNNTLLPVKNPSIAWVENQKKLESIHAWDLYGKIGVSDGVSAKSFEISWAQKENGDYELKFYGPLDVKVGTVFKNDQGVFLKTSQGLQKADNPESLMQQEFGWSLPIVGLSHWIRGLPMPSMQVSQVSQVSQLSSQLAKEKVQKLNAFGYLSKLQDQINNQINNQDIQISYLNYEQVSVKTSQGSTQTVALPTRMIFTQGSLRVVLVIESWRFLS